MKTAAKRITEDLAGIGLKVHKEDRVPMSWVTFDRSHKHLLKNLQKTGRIEMRFVPGQWYVTLLYWPEDAEPARRERKVIGTVTVTKSGAGTTLEVEPLDE